MSSSLLVQGLLFPLDAAGQDISQKTDGEDHAHTTTSRTSFFVVEDFDDNALLQPGDGLLC